MIRIHELVRDGKNDAKIESLDSQLNFLKHSTYMHTNNIFLNIEEITAILSKEELNPDIEKCLKKIAYSLGKMIETSM